MGLFDKLFARKSRRVPRWAEALGDRERFDAFVEDVRLALEALGLEIDAAMIESGSVMLAREGKPPKEVILHALATECAEAKRDLWPLIAAATFSPPPAQQKQAQQKQAQQKQAQQKQPNQGQKPQPGDLLLQFGADGSAIITSADTRISMNAVRADDPADEDGDAPPLPTELTGVAYDIAVHFGSQRFDWLEPTYRDAVILLARVGQPPPACKDPTRRALTAVAHALGRGDRNEALHLARAAKPRDRALFGACLQTLLAVEAPRETAALVAERRWLALPELLGPLAAVAPDEAAALLGAVKSPDENARRAQLVGAYRALVAAHDAGQPTTALYVRWWEARTAELEREWREHEVGHLAHVDLAAAGALRTELLSEYGEHEADDVTTAYFRALARSDGAAALAAVSSDGEAGGDVLPRLRGCAEAGLDVTTLVDAQIDALGPGSYRPVAHFFGVVDLCIRLGDATRLRRSLERGGPKRWQIAWPAYDAIGVAARRGQADALLPTLFDAYVPGVIAGRDASDGALHMGSCIYRPPMLKLPRPRTTLAVAAAVAAGARA